MVSGCQASHPLRGNAGAVEAQALGHLKLLTPAALLGGLAPALEGGQALLVSVAPNAAAGLGGDLGGLEQPELALDDPEQLGVGDAERGAGDAQVIVRSQRAGRVLLLRGREP